MTTEKPEESKGTKLNFRTEGFIVAGASLLGYLAAYRYEIGIADYWDIPRTLVELSLASVVASAFAIFFFLAVGIFYLNPVVMFLGSELVEEDSTRRRFMIIHLLFAVTIFGAIWAVGFDKTVLLSLIIFFVFLDFITAIGPWLWMRFVAMEGDGFFNRIHLFWNAPNQPPDIYDWAQHKTGVNRQILALAVVFIIGFYYLAWGAGYKSARNETDFLINAESHIALVRRYGDIFVFRSVNDDNNKFCENLTLLMNNELSKLDLREAKIKSEPKKGWSEGCQQQIDSETPSEISIEQADPVILESGPLPQAPEAESPVP